MMKIYLASRLHENSVSPSGNQETFVTISVWPRSSASVSPVKMSHTRSVRSAAAEARRRCRPLSASHLIGAKAPEKNNYKMIASKWVKNSVIIVSKCILKKCLHTRRYRIRVPNQRAQQRSRVRCPHLQRLIAGAWRNIHTFRRKADIINCTVVPEPSPPFGGLTKRINIQFNN